MTVIDEIITRECIDDLISSFSVSFLCTVNNNQLARPAIASAVRK